MRWPGDSMQEVMDLRSLRQNQSWLRRPSWFLPLVALILVLWFEAEIPSLPPLVQGTALWRALGDSSLGQGLEGLLSARAVFDVIRRLGALLAGLAVAWLLAQRSPDAVHRHFALACARVMGLPKRRFGVILFLLAVIIPLGYFALIRGFTPRLGDEIAYLFQARLFTEGRVSMPAPAMSEFFQIRLVTVGSRWFSQYPPGQPLFLAPALFLGVPWIVGPLAGGAAVIGIWLLGARLYNEETGRLAGALALFSPFFWFNSGSYLSHSTCLAMACFATLGLVKSIQEDGKRSWISIIGGGAALGAAALIRPLTALGLALGLSLFVLIWIPSLAAGSGRRRPRILGLMFLFAISAAAVASIVPLYNRATTGSALRWGYEITQRSSHALGFGKRGDLDIDFTPARALFNTRTRQRWLDGGFQSGQNPIPGGGFFFWPFPAVAVPLALLCRRRFDRTDLALAGVLVCIAAIYYPYYYLEICWGPRFFYESAFVLLLLTARGAGALGDLAQTAGWVSTGSGRSRSGMTLVAALLIPAIIIAMIHVGLPTGTTRDKLYDPVTWPTRRVDAALETALRREGVEEGLVFLEGVGAFYETAWRRMFVERNKKITYARDLGQANKKLIESFQGRYCIATYNDDPWFPAFHVRIIGPMASDNKLRGNSGSQGVF